MKCPIDNIEMQNRIYEGTVEIDECPSCQGIWLDKGELEKIEQTRDNDYKKFLEEGMEARPFSDPRQSRGATISAALPMEDRNLTCPSCSMPMHQKEHGYFSKIMIDCCLNCEGIWLDQGELQDIEIFFERNKPAEEMSFWTALTIGFQGLFS